MSYGVTLDVQRRWRDIRADLCLPMEAAKSFAVGILFSKEVCVFTSRLSGAWRQTGRRRARQGIHCEDGHLDMLAA